MRTEIDSSIRRSVVIAIGCSAVPSPFKIVSAMIINELLIWQVNFEDSSTFVCPN